MNQLRAKVVVSLNDGENTQIISSHQSEFQTDDQYLQLKREDQSNRMILQIVPRN